MNQTAFNFNLLPPNPFMHGTGNYRVYEWLQEHRQIYLSELHHTLKVDTARLRTDIRPYLRRNGLDYEVVRIRDGETLYRIVTP